MKRLFLIFTAVVILAACSNNEDDVTENNKQQEDSPLSVYTTVYPLQYFTERIGGDSVEVHSIYPPGADEHTFDPTQKDMMELADADLFLYVGLGLEGFVNNAEKTLKNEHVNLFPVAEAMDTTKFLTFNNEEHHEDDGHGHGEHDSQFDPHIWISPVLSVDLARAVTDALIAEAPENSDLYEANFSLLQEELHQLDDDFKVMAAQAQTKTFFVSHAAFGYLAHDYGLEQIAIAGINSQSEPSQKQLADLVKQAELNNVKYVMFEQNVSSKLTEVIQKEIGAEALLLHNLGVRTTDDLNNNDDYFSLMQHNLETLEKALN